MAPFSVGRFPLGLLLISVFLSASGMSQSLLGKSLPSTPASISLCTTRNSEQAQVPPTGDRACGLRLEYVGLYNPEGQFEPLLKPTRWNVEHGIGSNDPAVRVNRLGMRPEEVPPFLKLQPLERVVNDYQSSYHVRKVMRGGSHLGGILNAFVTFAYGNERPLLAPQHLTTDSRGRAIITDPKVPAIHVLDSKSSFRIVGGPHRRLQSPNGVAVDGEDNIYVADSSLGLVLVYDSLGRYLRSIGRIDKDETMLHRPTGIAIDRKAGRLYVADALRERIFVFDLQGRPLDRIGVPSADDGSITFDHPTDIALRGNELVVLDAGGSRIQIVDIDGHLLHRFYTGASDPHHLTERGLGVDERHNIYVSNLPGEMVRIYNSAGVLVGAFASTDNGRVGFKSLEGLWIDGDNRIFVADTGNRQVQVFRLSTDGIPQATD